MVKKTTRGRWVFFLLGVFGVAIVGLHQWAPIDQWPGRLITRDDSPTKADVIVVLMGSVVSRAEKARELYLKGVAPKILWVKNESGREVELHYRLNDGDAVLAYLSSYGVPPSSLVYFDDSAVTSTHEEAERIFSLLGAMEPRPEKIVIVTDWYHTSRSYFVFSRQKPSWLEIEMAAATSPTSRPEVWYRYEGAFLATFTEYLKWTYYLLNEVLF